MKKLIISLKAILIATILVSCNKDDGNSSDAVYEETVAVANRPDGTVTFIDGISDQVKGTLNIPGSNLMYVVYAPARDKIYVGDYNGFVYVVNPQSKLVEKTIPVGNGVFHMWADGLGKQLWVNNELDKTISVINLETNAVVKTIEVDMKPHDVFVTKDGLYAYVTLIDPEMAQPDKVYMFSTTTYAKLREASVGKDPHLYHIAATNKLFVPCQSGEVYSLKGTDLSLINNVAFEGAHGIFPSPDQSSVYITNISGSKLYSVNATTSIANGPAVNSNGIKPHNIVVNEVGNKMYVTHANGSKVSIYYIVGTTIVNETTSVTVGNNPFGLAYYRREVK